MQLASKLSIWGESWEPHAKGDASAFSRKNWRACLQVKGDEEPSQVLLLSSKMKTEWNSQAVFFFLSVFKVKYSVLQIIHQCDGLTRINSVEVSQPSNPSNTPLPPINSICQRLKLYTNIQCTVRREAILGRTLPD